MDVILLPVDSSPWLEPLREYAGRRPTVSALGNLEILRSRKLAVICSRKCPGDVILKTYDFARLVRDSGIAVASGFHSPIERESLSVLLRGTGPIVLVQAHRLSTSRVPREWRKAIEAGRLLLLSPFTQKDKRVSAELAAERNRFVAAISDEVLVPYAAPGGKTEALALDLLKSGKPVYTFSERPGPLLAAGARVATAKILLSLQYHHNKR